MRLHTNLKVINGSGSEPAWKPERRQRKQPQANASAPEFASINKYTHAQIEQKCVCVCHSECGHCISCTDLLQVSINHGRPTSHARSKALSQQYTEKWLFISTALYSHKLLTIDFAPARTNTQQHGQTDTHWAACKSTLNTCHNKELPATKRREKYRPTPHAAHKTHTHTHFSGW